MGRSRRLKVRPGDMQRIDHPPQAVAGQRHSRCHRASTQPIRRPVIPRCALGETSGLVSRTGRLGFPADGCSDSSVNFVVPVEAVRRATIGPVRDAVIGPAGHNMEVQVRHALPTSRTAGVQDDDTRSAQGLLHRSPHSLNQRRRGLERLSWRIEHPLAVQPRNDEGVALRQLPLGAGTERHGEVFLSDPSGGCTGDELTEDAVDLFGHLVDEHDDDLAGSARSLAKRFRPQRTDSSQVTVIPRCA